MRHEIPNVGRSRKASVLEALRTSAPGTVEQAIEASGKTNDVQRRRGLRSHYLGRSRVQR